MRASIGALVLFGLVGCFKTPQTSIPDGAGAKGGAGAAGGAAGAGAAGGAGAKGGTSGTGGDAGTAGVGGAGAKGATGGTGAVGGSGAVGGTDAKGGTGGMGGSGATAGTGATSGCDGGTCSCTPPNTQCPNACTNLATDTNNCTACGHVCLPPPANGRAICQAAAGCGVQCDTGHLKCGNTCCDTPPASAFATCSASNECGLQCNSGNHACNGTSSPCYVDNDVTHCGTACLDCRQPNATAVCNGTQCANICTGSTLACAGIGGKPNCGSWSFESGTIEGWRIDTTQGSQDASDGTIVASSTRSFTGTRSLAIGFSGDGVSKYDLRVVVNLCSGGDALTLVGKTFHANLFLDRRTGSSLTGTGQTGTVQSGPASDLQFHDFSFDDAGQWIPIGVPISGPATTYFEMILPITAPWSGTVYLDDVQIE
jgi:hypothetical protein